MAIVWKRSSYSGSNGTNCVELAHGMVRDSKNPQVVLKLSAAAMRQLIEQARSFQPDGRYHT